MLHDSRVYDDLNEWDFITGIFGQQRWVTIGGCGPHFYASVSNAVIMVDTSLPPGTEIRWSDIGLLGFNVSIEVASKCARIFCLSQARSYHCAGCSWHQL
eukprot:4476602-Pleurochrysis_carterae.AAC.1